MLKKVKVTSSQLVEFPGKEIKVLAVNIQPKNANSPYVFLGDSSADRSIGIVGLSGKPGDVALAGWPFTNGVYVTIDANVASATILLEVE